MQCSVCGRLMLSAVGEFCERCALSACRDCKKLSEKNNPCRVLSISPNEPFLHHWVKGCTHTLTIYRTVTFFFFKIIHILIFYIKKSEPYVKIVIYLPIRTLDMTSFVVGVNKLNIFRPVSHQMTRYKILITHTHLHT